ncbi:MAG: hypothetical protein KatS3mg061_1770 [Dehalococcoidia bacterium]|nr:MAG: hypothetical protein KatS3mg061_1770 [Dehalococcoidia bacterium]
MSLVVHSARRGVGRSQIAANLAALLAAMGSRVGLVDGQSEQSGGPGLEDFSPAEVRQRWWRYLGGGLALPDLAWEVRPRLWLLPAVLWHAWLAPPRSPMGEPGAFQQCLGELVAALALDWLIVESGSGLGEEALLALAAAEALVVVVRPDAQEVQATAVLLALAEQLGVGWRWLVVNQAPAGRSRALRQAFARAYRMPVATVLPLVPELAAWHGDGFFALAQPTHPWSMGLRELLATVQRAGGWRGLAERGGGHDP